MQKFTQKYTIISLLEDAEEGYRYSSNDWPLHTTIADTFSITWSVDKLIDELSRLASSSLRELSTKAADYEYFGPHQQIQVTILEMNKEIEKLHYDVVGLLKKAGVVFNDPQYTEDGFRAHSTVQSHARVKPGENIIINNIALIDMFPDEDPYQRKILKIIKI